MKPDKRPAFARPLLLTLFFAGACGTDPLPDQAGSDTTVENAALTATAVKPTATSATTAVISRPPPPELLAPSTVALETGAGWRRVQVSGNAEDVATGTTQPLFGEFYVFDGRASIDNSSLPANTRAVLNSKMRTMPMPADGDDEIIVMPKALNDAVQSNIAAFSLCDDSNNQTFSKTYSFNRSADYHRPSEPGALTGSADFHTNLTGSVTGTVKYSIKYHYCIPTLVLHRVTVQGNADVVANASLAAQFQKRWSWETEVAAPVLGTASFFGIPVTFKAPISVGIDAQGAASLNFQGSYQAHGSFNIHCSKQGGCDGDKTATSGFTPGGSPVVAATAKVKVTPWAQGALRAYVLDERVVYAQVGVRANLQGELWAYAGNTCGDGDHDGVNEFVTGSTLDLGIGIDVTAKAGIFGSDLGAWAWNVWGTHLGFWGTGDALDPILYGKGCGGTNTATMHLGMRPCWPYKDAITYKTSWGDGATNTVSGTPGALVTQTHAFASTGVKSVRVDTVQDAKGRAIAGDATRSVNVSWIPVVCLDDLVLSQ
jgi:hypothetical protein